uniref:Ubiquitin-like protease family profile domain-containing protein n=1 Tax=Sphaeramia orbicularis TaxID=375764 RepID=A0A673CCT0_9TELE
MSLRIPETLIFLQILATSLLFSSFSVCFRGLDIGVEVSRYRAGLASTPVAGFMVTYNKHTLSLEDLGALEEQNWLNDQIINMYGELIMDATQQKVHFFNSFFHKQLVAKGYDGVKRWTKKVDLFSKWLLLIPIHLEIHWSLVTVAMATKTINYYDSQACSRGISDIVCLLSVINCDLLTLQGIPQQKNDSDCGVFVLEYCRCLSVKQPLLFSQEDMPQIRKRIYKELCDCRLND